MSASEIISQAIRLYKTGQEENRLKAVQLLDREYPNYKNEDYFVRNYAILCSNYGIESTRKDFEGYRERNRYLKLALNVHKGITLEQMDIRTAWVLYTANMAGFMAVPTGNIEKMEEAYAMVREARTLHMYQPIEQNVIMMERGLPSMHAYICYWLAMEYMKGETENLPKASNLLTEAYRIVIDEVKSGIRNCDLNPNITDENKRQKVILTDRHIADAKDSVDKIYCNRKDTVRPMTFGGITIGKVNGKDMDKIFDSFFEKPAPDTFAAGTAGKGQTNIPKNTVRFCGNCGNPVKPGDRFCGSCGAATDGSAPPAPEKKSLFKRFRK